MTEPNAVSVDDLEALLKEIEEAPDDPPEEVLEAATDNASDEAKAKALKAWKRERGTIRRLAKELRERQTSPEPEAQSEPQPQGVVGATTGANVYSQLLRAQTELEAGNNVLALGYQDLTSEDAQWAYQREVNRIWQEKMGMVQRQQAAIASAGGVLSQVEQEFAEKLSPEEVALAKARIAKLSPEDQANPDEVRQVFFGQVGAKAASTGKSRGAARGADHDDAVGAAAASSVGAGNLGGVEPGETGRSPEAKPLTGEDRLKAKRMGLNPDDPKGVATYRRAQQRAKNVEV